MPLPLVRSYEKIGYGVRTQIEYFYQKFQVLLVCEKGDILSKMEACSDH